LFPQPYEIDWLLAAAEDLHPNGFNLFGKNCEHFARWCKTGEHHSSQVQTVTASAAGAGGSAALTAGAVGVMTAAGTAAGVSGGAGVMAGLASVGGTAVGGLGALAVAPTAAAVVAMKHVLADDPHLSEHERIARKHGRTGTVVGAATGAAASVAALSAAGSVAGLSAAGITSGLAAIGGAVGGGMVAGVAVTICAPAVMAAGVSYAVYRYFKSQK
jgi:hypothetical protein